LCLLSAAAAQEKKKKDGERATKELSTHISEPTVHSFLLPPTFFFLNLVSPCYLSMSTAPQCKKEILTKKYDCSLSEDERENTGVECFTLRAWILLYYFLASLH
jgi:hypothetical protein